MFKIKHEIKRSKIYFAILIMLYGAAVTAALVAMMPWYYKFALVLFLIILFGFDLKNKVLLKSKRSIRQIEANADGGWILQNGYGRSWHCILAGDSFRSTFMIILNFKIPGRLLVWPIVIFYDAMSPQMFHQLRVELWMQRKSMI